MPNNLSLALGHMAANRLGKYEKKFGILQGKVGLEKDPSSGKGNQQGLDLVEYRDSGKQLFQRIHNQRPTSQTITMYVVVNQENKSGHQASNALKLPT